MPRKPRIEYPGACYHVMCRGNNGENVLGYSDDKKLYLYLLEKYKERYCFKIYAYCIMDNHVHLLIETGNTPLSKIMQGIQQSYTQTYNKKYDRTGHAFQQRYKAILCDSDSYLLKLVKYIHRNPIEAWKDEGLNYKWSSHGDYLSINKKSLVEVEFVLSILERDIKIGLKEYKRFMELDEGEIDINNFHVDEEELYLTLEKFKERNKVSSAPAIDLEDIIKGVCIRAGLSIDEIKKRSKIKKYVTARNTIVLFADKYSQAPNTLISKKLNLSQSTISWIKRQGRSHNDEVESLSELVLTDLLKMRETE